MEAFVRFSVSYLRRAAGRRIEAEELIRAYNESLTELQKEDGQGADFQYFRQNLLSVRRLRTAPTVDEAIAQIGYGRTNYGDVPLGRCSFLKPDSADIINWCKNFYRNMAKYFSPTRAAIESAWEAENPGQIKRMFSLFSIGVLTMMKLARLIPGVAGCSGHSEGGGSEEEEEAAGAPAQDPPSSGRALLAAVCASSPSPASKARLQQDEEDSSSPDEGADIPSADSAPAVHIAFCKAYDKTMRRTAPQRAAITAS